jgi:hypothetical protein
MVISWCSGKIVAGIICPGERNTQYTEVTMFFSQTINYFHKKYLHMINFLIQ